MDYLTIDELNPATSAASGDYIPFWRTANGDTRKITKVNFIGANITGGGTIATGGYTLTLSANATIAGNADETQLAINSAPAKTTPIDADTMPLMDSAASNVLKKITWANLKATLFALTAKNPPIDADSTVIIDSAAGNVPKSVTFTNIKAFLKTYFDTLYGLKGSANTWSVLQTYSAGISLGNETLSSYDEGVWNADLTGSTGNPTITYSAQAGKYTRIGNLVFYQFFIIVNTISGGSGDVRVSLPITVGAPAYGVAFLYGTDLPGAPISAFFSPVVSAAYGNYSALQDNGPTVNLPISGVVAGDWLGASGFYFA